MLIKLCRNICTKGNLFDSKPNDEIVGYASQCSCISEWGVKSNRLFRLCWPNLILPSQLNMEMSDSLIISQFQRILKQLFRFNNTQYCFNFAHVTQSHVLKVERRHEFKRSADNLWRTLSERTSWVANFFLYSSLINQESCESVAVTTLCSANSSANSILFLALLDVWANHNYQNYRV
jgi:hypothetical protein